MIDINNFLHDLFSGLFLGIVIIFITMYAKKIRCKDIISIIDKIFIISIIGIIITGSIRLYYTDELLERTVKLFIAAKHIIFVSIFFIYIFFRVKYRNTAGLK